MEASGEGGLVPAGADPAQPPPDIRPAAYYQGEEAPPVPPQYKQEAVQAPEEPSGGYHEPPQLYIQEASYEQEESARGDASYSSESGDSPSHRPPHLSGEAMTTDDESPGRGRKRDDLSDDDLLDDYGGSGNSPDRGRKRKRLCRVRGCGKLDKGRGFCKAHGGGKRCIMDGCSKSARGSSGRCITHGGGPRCVHESCQKSARTVGGYCKAHGGGRRCRVDACQKTARGRGQFCVEHHELEGCGVVEHAAAGSHSAMEISTEDMVHQPLHVPHPPDAPPLAYLEHQVSHPGFDVMAHAAAAALPQEALRHAEAPVVLMQAPKVDMPHAHMDPALAQHPGAMQMQVVGVGDVMVKVGVSAAHVHPEAQLHTQQHQLRHEVMQGGETGLLGAEMGLMPAHIDPDAHQLHHPPPHPHPLEAMHQGAQDVYGVMATAAAEIAQAHIQPTLQQQQQQQQMPEALPQPPHFEPVALKHQGMQCAQPMPPVVLEMAQLHIQPLTAPQAPPQLPQHQEPLLGGEALRVVGLGDAHVQHELPATQPHVQHEHEGHYAMLQAAPAPQQQTYEAPQFAMAFAPAPEVAEYQYQAPPPPSYVGQQPQPPSQSNEHSHASLDGSTYVAQQLQPPSLSNEHSHASMDGSLCSHPSMDGSQGGAEGMAVYVEQQPVEVLKQRAVPQPPIGEGIFTSQGPVCAFEPVILPAAPVAMNHIGADGQGVPQLPLGGAAPVPVPHDAAAVGGVALDLVDAWSGMESGQVGYPVAFVMHEQQAVDVASQQGVMPVAAAQAGAAAFPGAPAQAFVPVLPVRPAVTEDLSMMSTGI